MEPAIEGPAEIDGSGASSEQGGVGVEQARVGGIGAKCEPKAISGGCADERRSAYKHGTDGVGGLVERGEACGDELVRELCLVDDFD